MIQGQIALRSIAIEIVIVLELLVLERSKRFMENLRCLTLNKNEKLLYIKFVPCESFEIFSCEFN